MRKSISTIAAGLCTLILASCASSGKSESTRKIPSVPHPRTYVLDMIDAGEKINVPKNQYGPNYQYYGHFWKNVKTDKPLAGDTVTFHLKGTSDIDIPELRADMVDSSPSANYWTILSTDEDQTRVIASDIKAGETFQCEITYTLAKDSKGAFDLVIFYDEEIGKSANIIFDRLVDSTDTSREGIEAPKGPMSYSVQIEKYAAFLEIPASHPWVNGKEDTSIISNYQTEPDMTNAFLVLPRKGDTINFTWRGKSNTNIKNLHARLIDRSPAANWWKELESSVEGQVIATDIKKDEVFETSFSISLDYDPVEQVNLMVWYDVGDAEGSSIIMLAR